MELKKGMGCGGKMIPYGKEIVYIFIFLIIYFNIYFLKYIF